MPACLLPLPSTARLQTDGAARGPTGVTAHDRSPYVTFLICVSSWCGCGIRYRMPPVGLYRLQLLIINRFMRAIDYKSDQRSCRPSPWKRIRRCGLPVRAFMARSNSAYVTRRPCDEGQRAEGVAQGSVRSVSGSRGKREAILDMERGCGRCPLPPER